MRRCLAVGLLVLITPLVRTAEPEPLRFRVTFTPEVCERPFSGRVFVVASRKETRGLPERPSWFKPEPFFAWDVTDWKPGESRILDGGGLAFPEPLTKLPPAEYSLQAVLDLDRGDQNPLASEGNGHSKPTRLKLDPATSGLITLTIDQVYPTRKFEESERLKLVDIPSALLTKFHGKPMRLRAGVVLPRSFPKEPDRRYPVIYEIPGFGGTHRLAALRSNATDVAGVDMLHVMLDPACRLGHHVFADSANNGPCGQALIEELIPPIEKTYRGLGVPAGRFVTGHSSGGWSSLWLQITYPDFFGGVWSTAPDPVDFRDFQRVNIYTDTNIFTDPAGKPRPLARKGGKVLLHCKPFSDMETVLGRGGQLFSFEAVFSPRGHDGKPRPLWDRASGEIDPVTAKSWEKYDVRLVLERRWKTLAPKLAGKIHVYMGAEDNYYLDGATALLKKSLAELGSDAVVEIFPRKDHGTLLDQTLRTRIAREMAEQYRKSRHAP